MRKGEERDHIYIYIRLQLLTEQRVIFPNSGGILPVKKLLPRRKLVRDVNNPSETGRLPLNKLEVRVRVCNLKRAPMVEGILPVKVLTLKSITVRLVRRVIWIT